MVKEFLDLTGVSTFLTYLKNIFATKAAVQEVKTNTDIYVTEVDYSQIAFDTSEIVSK